MDSVDPAKYVTFKRDDSISVTDGYVTYKTDSELADAVVIRRQDLFAGPALHAYANNMVMAARMVAEGDEQKRLLGIADYFHEQAVMADEQAWKMPD